MSNLKLSTYISTIPVRNNEKIRADERLTYQFEVANIGQFHWNRLSRELSRFYSMCGYSIFHSSSHFDPEYCAVLSRCTRRYFSSLPLPLHNPVAFFHQLMTLKCPKKDLRLLFYVFLPYALSSSGIAFGTAFDREGGCSVRLCDMKYIVPLLDDQNIYNNLLIQQTQLKSGHRFYHDFAHYSLAIMELMWQHERICEWRKEWETDHTGKAEYPPFSRPLPWCDNLNQRENIFFSFLDLYEHYCISQLSKDTPFQHTTCKQTIDDIRLSAHFIFQMERITLPLLDILHVENPDENRALRKQWIENARSTLQSDRTMSQLKSLKKCFPDDFAELTETNHLFTHISTNFLLRADQLKPYPLLNEHIVFRRLTAREKKDLFWYRKHPVAQWINRLCAPSSKASFRKIMPFYLCFYFWNQEKPLRPFNRFNGRFSPKVLFYDSTISFSSHARSVRLQNSHHKFYLDVISWCKKHFSDTVDVPLCHSLYTIYHSYLVTEKPTRENYSLPNQLYIVYQGLLNLFDFPVSMLPQYTHTPITENEFNYFFYIDPSRTSKDIRKYICHFVTPELADEYNQLAFLDPDGFGHTYFTEKWHHRIADWLSNLINNDKTLSSYVQLDTPNLARIELAIQFQCCQQIQKTLSQSVLRFFKHLWSPD